MNFDKVKLYLPWLFRAVVLLVIVALAWALNSARNANAELKRNVEKEKLEKAGFVVALQQSKADMAELERKLLAENAWLENEVQRLKDELGKKPKVVYVEIIKTVPAQVIGDPFYIPCPNSTEKVPCMLPVGSTGHVEAKSITYETKENNHVMFGTAECWRDTPEPKAMLFTARFDASATKVIMEEEKPAGSKLAGWGAGVRGSAGNVGWLVGPVFAFPPLPFIFSTQVEFSVDATMGTPWPSYLVKPDSDVPKVLFEGGLNILLRGR